MAAEVGVGTRMAALIPLVVGFLAAQPLGTAEVGPLGLFRANNRLAGLGDLDIKSFIIYMRGSVETEIVITR